MRKSRIRAFPSLDRGHRTQSPLIDRLLPFEEGLAQAEKDDRIIARLSHGILSIDQDVSPMALGTMAAYAKPGQKFGKVVERADPESRQRWVFPVPPEYRQEKDRLLYVRHPSWVIESDGPNRIVHSDARFISLSGPFPPHDGWYGLDRAHSFPTGNPLSPRQLDRVIAEKRHRKIGYAGYLARIPKFVGPVVISYSGYRTDYDWPHLFISRFDLNWKPSWNCMLVSTWMFGVETIKSELALLGLPENHPLRVHRKLTEDQIAHVIVRGPESVERLPLLNGTSLRSLRNRSNIPFFCTVGACGVCRVDVLKGMANLSRPGQHEMRVLFNFEDHHPGQRLACITKIKKGEVEVSIPVCRP